MRLIDVDAFKNDYHMADECKDCQTPVRTCEYDRVYTKMDFCEWLDSAPTIEPQLPEWAQKVEEYRQSAPSHIHNPLAWALYQTWKEYDR